jgi:hypothetical protein
MPRVTQLHEPCFFDLVILIDGVCPTSVSKLLVLDKIQRILDTAIVVNLNYPWKAQSEVTRIGRPIKAGTNDLNNERTGEKLGRLSHL